MVAVVAVALRGWRGSQCGRMSPSRANWMVAAAEVNAIMNADVADDTAGSMPISSISGPYTSNTRAIHEQRPDELMVGPHQGQTTSSSWWDLIKDRLHLEVVSSGHALERWDVP